MEIIFNNCIFLAIFAKDNDERVIIMSKQINKEKFYIIVILLVTFFSVSMMLNYSGKPTQISVTTGYTNTLATIDDNTLESFINLYTSQILLKDNYIVTAENRENIRRLLNSMGQKNILDLKNNLFSGGNDEVKVITIKDFISKHFMPEDYILLSQYITI